MIELLDDPGRFADRVGRLLRSTVENTVLATVAEGAIAGRYDEFRGACVVDDDGTPIGAALRTPPHRMVVTRLDETDADALIDRWLAADPDLPGMMAPRDTARRLAAYAATDTGVEWPLRERERLHATDARRLRPPARPAPGRLRPATADDADLCVSWERAFAAEADVALAAEADRAARHRLAAARTYLWDVDGEAVCLVGHTTPAADVPRVGPVYTPPSCRNRGFASSAVHALTARLIDAGAPTTVLFTDVANPTSNHVYADLGYEAVGDFEVYERSA